MKYRNGEALTKRYEVTDLETGEVLDEPLYVLRPLSDHFARSCMFAYARLCGLRDHDHEMLVAIPFENPTTWRDILAEFLLPLMDPAPDTDSFEGEQFKDLANKGPGADGSMEYAYKLLESLGVEVVHVIGGWISEERQQEANDWLEAHKRRQEAEELAPQ